jgi:protein SCO1/2
MKPRRILLFAFLLLIVKCHSPESKLPILSGPEVPGENVPGKIADFSFIDQDSSKITGSTFHGKIYVADFIFLSCPTICPKMNVEMLRVYREFEKEEDVLFLSHTIDPVNDSIPRLKAYAENIGISSAKWHFVTGHMDSIYSIAKKSYFTSVYPDSTDKSNFIHGGGLVLVDKEKLIRGVYDGTNPEETKRLINDIRILLKEYKK